VRAAPALRKATSDVSLVEMAPLLALITILALQTPAPVPAADAPAGKRAAVDIAALIEPIRLRHDLPGIVAAIVDREGAVAIGACGVRERGQSASLSILDRMHLGSCTKSMTATLCARLVARDVLGWKTTIGEHFADSGDGFDAGWKSVTLEQLLTLRGGVGGDIAPKLWGRLFTSKATPRAQREELARGILASPPKSTPGTQFEYSNASFAIAGLMAERAAGKDFEELMQLELFTPLAMASAGFGPPLSTKSGGEPIGHRPNGQSVGTGIGSDNPPAIAPAGRVHASLGDWAEYAALHLRGAKDGGLDIPAAQFARMQAQPADELDAYAMGWGIAQREWGGRVLTHTGSNTMWFCVAWLAPEKGFGVLVATNQGGDAAEKACDEAASALIQAWTKRAGAAK